MSADEFPSTPGVARVLRGARSCVALFVVVAVSSYLAACQEKAAPVAAPPPEVLVTPVVQQDVPITSEWVGTTEGYINAQITAKVKGYLLSRDYREGALVKKGDLLFQIDPRQYQAELDQAKGQLGRAQAALEKSRLDVARYTPLAREGAVSQQELDNAVQAARANQAQVDSARAAVEQAQLNLRWTRIESPIDGIAGIAVAQVGDLISENSKLTTVSQLDPIKVLFPISEQEYLQFAAGIQRVEKGGDSVSLDLILGDGSTYPYKGKADTANRQVDVKTGTILIQALFPNPNNLLRPGQFARVRAVTRVDQGALLVPQRAVQEVQGQFQVAVVKPDNTVELRPVTVGERVGSMWIVREGLKPDDRVVAEGLQRLRSGMTVTVKPFVAEATPGQTPAAAPPGA
jgi:RND family efflux transporter MFP subunit